MSHIETVKSKILTDADLARKVDIWKMAGNKVVFTNGCFDLLHKGHIDYLNRAADCGDVLVVGVNSDESVSRLKGPHRPIQDESSRLWVLASLECVTAVILFGEETPIKLIQKVSPNVLVKGGDYTVETIVGAQEVLSSGGIVEVIPFLEGYSTSRLEDKIRRWDNHPS